MSLPAEELIPPHEELRSKEVVQLYRLTLYVSILRIIKSSL